MFAVVFAETDPASILALPRALGAVVCARLGPIRRRLHPQLGSRKPQVPALDLAKLLQWNASGVRAPVIADQGLVNDKKALSADWKSLDSANKKCSFERTPATFAPPPMNSR
jgi:hypothetical protein